MAVFVLDKRKRPLMPCSEKRARKLLESGRARVHRLIPFVIRLVDRHVSESELQALQIKLDPGSKTTGIALVGKSEAVNAETGEVTATAHVLSLFELLHRGRQIGKALTARRQMRRRRRGTLRYRAPRFLDRANKASGWLAPSLKHRVETTAAWVDRLRHLAPVTHIAQELVRFDTQQMENPRISGIEYQQGTLVGYETREYLLEKWGRECAYCGAKAIPLQVEHLHPKAKGGSNRISNLTLACEKCNTKKAAQDVREFLAKDPKRLERILAQVKRPLKDAAAVNATRWALFNALKATGLPVTTGSGGLTKFNRSRLGIPKTHALDAVCVGVTNAVTGWWKPTLTIQAMGRGRYQRSRLDRFGFPRGYLTRQKRIKGFQTGDRVIARVTTGKKAGIHFGRVAVRVSGRFNIQTAEGVVQGIAHRHCRVIQRADGYGYSQRGTTSKATPAAPSPLYLPALKGGVSRVSMKNPLKQRILVTGGAGFLGSHLCERLLESGHDVLCVDNFFTGSKDNIVHLLDNPRFELMRHDVTFALYVEVDQIYNLACPASPVHYQFDPVQTTKTSVHGAINTLGLAKRVKARIFQASTSEVYGDPEVHPQHESYWGRVNPIGLRACYDEGKRCAETLFFDYHRQHGLDIKVARIFNTYGPRMNSRDGRVVSNFVVQALKGEPITLYGDGSQTRAFCYVDDLIEGFIRLMNSRAGLTGPVNLGNPGEFTIRQLAEKILSLTGSRSELVFKPLPSDDPTQRRPDISLAKEELDWEPKVPLDEGLVHTVAYFDRLIGQGLA